MSAATDRAERYLSDIELFGDVEPAGTALRAMTHGEVLTLAEEWASRGVGVFPIKIMWDPEKAKTNKVPLTDHGFLDAATEQRAVRLMFNKVRPLQPGEALGVGLHLGPAGLLAIDVDDDNNVVRSRTAS